MLPVMPARLAACGCLIVRVKGWHCDSFEVIITAYGCMSPYTQYIQVPFNHSLEIYPCQFHV